MTKLRTGLARIVRKHSALLSRLAFKLNPAWKVAEWEQDLFLSDDNDGWFEPKPLKECLCGKPVHPAFGWHWGSLGSRHRSAYQIYCSRECAFRYRRSETA